jgi:hypothetical protein
MLAMDVLMDTIKSHGFVQRDYRSKSNMAEVTTERLFTFNEEGLPFTLYLHFITKYSNSRNVIDHGIIELCFSSNKGICLYESTNIKHRRSLAKDDYTTCRHALSPVITEIWFDTDVDSLIKNYKAYTINYLALLSSLKKERRM